MTNFINTIDLTSDTVVGPTIIELWALAQLDDIIYWVSNGWLANDGGLTDAAIDHIALANNAKDAIMRGDSTWAKWGDLFYTDTGVEQDILEVVCRFFD